MNKFTKSALLLGAATIISTNAFAQSTSSSIRGVVTGADGAPISGAKVTIVYVPTGRVTTATTTANGAYSARGLRVGGPYTITVTAPGSQPEIKEGLSFSAGTPVSVNFDLESLAAIDEIIVVGQRIQDINLEAAAGSAFSASDVMNQPSVGRDLTDTLLRDPLTNSDGTTGVLVIGGMNPRFNAISIDGIQARDDFGLRSSVYSGNRSPVSLDTVESVSLIVSDYSVLNSGFRGGLVNVVTKSGTNDLEGAIFYERSGSGLQGSNTAGRIVDPGDYKEETYGITLGGPIIKDKLYFFGNYEKYKTAIPVEFTGRDFDVAAFDALAPYIEAAFGFDPGTRGDVVSNPTTNEKILAKLDWDINDNHRASFSFRRAKDTGESIGNRYRSADYQRPIDVDNYAAQLYSDWSDKLSTEFRFGYRDKVLGQACNAGTDIGEIRIRIWDNDPSIVGTPLDGLINPGRRATFVAGCDRFRHANSFTDKRLQVFGKGTYLAGDHTLTIGGAFEDYALENFFVFDSRGRFTFDSLADLINRTGSVSYRNAQSNNVADAAASWGYGKLSLFAQDEWQINPDLALNAGIRYETFIQSDMPVDRVDFQNDYGRSNQNNLDGVDVIMPRIGFRYTPFDRTTISGGFGLYAGGNPLVWVSNAYQPQIFGSFASGLTGLDPRTIPQVLLDDIAASDPTSSADIDLIDPNFKTPSTWKASIKWEQEFDANFGGINLGDDYQFSVQYLYSKDRYGFRWENLAQTELAGSQPIGVAPDGRPIYADLRALDIRDAISLTNSKGGSGNTITVSLGKDYDFGGSFNVNYTYSDVESVTPGTSSRGISSLRATVTSDRNNPEAGISPFNTKHKFGLNFSYEKEFIEDLKTNVNLFGIITSGEPFSYTFDVSSNNSLFGRSSSGSPRDNDLLYVPAISGGAFSDPNVVFASGFDQQAFIDYINNRGLTPGAIADRNADDSSWNQLWNMRISQELPFGDFGQSRFEGNKLSVYMDIFNLPNLLNKNWGTRLRGSAFDTVRLVQADLVSAADVLANGVDGATALTGDAARTACASQTACVYRYNRFRPDSLGRTDDIASLYRIKLGIRYQW